MTTRIDAVGNDRSMLSDLDVPPEDLLRELRAVVAGFRREILPLLDPAAADDVVPALQIVAEELASLIGRLEAVEAEVLQRPYAADVRHRAGGLLTAANALSEVATRLTAAIAHEAVR